MEFPTEKDRLYWADVFKDHMDILSDLIKDDMLLDKTVDLYYQWKDVKHNHDWQRMDYLIPDTKSLKLLILSKIKQSYIGPVFPSLVKHMLKELEYYVNKTKKYFSLEEELLFWNDHSLDYATLDQHMLDPSEINKIYQLSKYQEGFQSLIRDLKDTDQDIYQLLFASIKHQTQLDNLHLNAKKVKPSSIISPKLLNHMIQEEQYGIKVLSSFE